MENLFLSTVLELYRENKWEEILKLNEHSDDPTALNLLWVWPSEKNLNFIKTVLNEYNLDGIVSIGCGCGLLEWIINKSTGFDVTGYEINKAWWESKYSNPKFIKLNYQEESLEENCLNSNYALLFCYFNNGPAFLEYINTYEGNVVFIIGPGKGKGRHTDPEPFGANFGSFRWRLYGYQEVKNSKDFIAVYVKNSM
ncbi:uncharacterized protein LOC108915102 [Anoplophora glabripennis]|uniref:uncharacterized protein LOC108915102 n=1 Tax=Anoplophora glabripennis TaxID=217634 RepID=UPI0008740254|nr:uncharacterized protein LOC108915102 [Anoplophora glabripennis]